MHEDARAELAPTGTLRVGTNTANFLLRPWAQRGPTSPARFLGAFVGEAKRPGLVARLIERHHVRGLSVTGLHG